MDLYELIYVLTYNKKYEIGSLQTIGGEQNFFCLNMLKATLT